MNPVGAALTFFFCCAVFFASRRYAAIAYLASVLYITQGQAIDIGVNFMAVRFVELACLARVISRGEIHALRFSEPDKWLLRLLWATFLITCVRNGAISMYSLGLAVDGTAVYLSTRTLITNEEECKSFLIGAAVLLLPFALSMTVEAIKGRNYFSLMGGVSSVPVYREGYFRAQGSFRHSITAGSIGATFLPLFIGLCFRSKHRLPGIIGIIASVSIVLASHSSGPLMGFVTAGAAWAAWFLRMRMSVVRKGIVLALIGLHLSMSKPVWFIYDRLSGIVGGDGWHRSNLIDKFLKNFGEWWLVGMPIEETGDWAATQMPWGGVDVTNQYVSTGIAGGLISLACLVLTLIAVFRLTGKALVAVRRSESAPVVHEALLWGAGATVCSHAVNISTVVYWDQSFVVWYMHLAIAVSLSSWWLSRYSKEENFGMTNSRVLTAPLRTA